MQILAFVFGVFGLIAYGQLEGLKKRIAELERQLAQLEGTAYARDREALARLAASCIGKSVRIEFKEDRQDVDVMMSGGGRITIVDADRDWLHIRIEKGKSGKEKLLRLESVKNICLEE